MFLGSPRFYKQKNYVPVLDQLLPIVFAKLDGDSSDMVDFEKKEAKQGCSFLLELDMSLRCEIIT